MGNSYLCIAKHHPATHVSLDAWLGSRVSVMPGVTIGEGAVVAGIPAKIIKTL